MPIKEFLDNICNQIKYKPIRNEILEELKNHIEEQKENYIYEGMEETKAEQKAINQMGDAEEIGKRLNKIHKPKLDWKLLLSIIIMLCFGFLVVITRVSSGVTIGYELDGVTKYIIILTVGLICSIFIYFLDYRKILKYSNILYIIASISIIYSLISGTMVNGMPYLDLKIITLSPTLIAIPLYIIAFVGFIQSINKESNIKIKILKENNININIIKIIILALISILLFAIIPSKASGFIVGVVYLIISTVKLLQLKQNKKRYILMLWAVPIILGVLLVMIYVGLRGSNYILDRVIVSFQPEKDPAGGGRNGMNQNLIINSAQIFGKAEDTSNALQMFDEGTNYAFISILAHYGWGISILMVLSIILLSMRLIINAIKIKDVYGKLLIIGIASVFILQSILNLLMNLNLGIKADFNIPLISYGGSNLVINMMCLALALSIYRRKDIICLKTL